MTQTTAPVATPATVFPDEPLRAAQGTFMAPLAHEGVLAVSGPDSARFLQGQITCDVASLALHDSRPGARCNPKGRMQSSFRLVRMDENEYLLAMRTELVERQRLELAKYAAFFKTQLSDASQLWRRIGLWGPAADTALSHAGLEPPASINGGNRTSAGTVFKVADAAYEIWLEADATESAIQRLRTTAMPASTEDWLLGCIRNGLGQVTEQTYESFIPQMLNMQLLGGVSFRKGCYTGQEIVARMQYLGSLKRRMYRLKANIPEAPLPGSPIVDLHTGRSVGEIVLAARAAEGVEMLAVLQKDAAQSPIGLVDINGPSLILSDLPYESELAASEAASDHQAKD